MYYRCLLHYSYIKGFIMDEQKKIIEKLRETIKRNWVEVLDSATIFVKWMCFAVLAGVVVGLFSILFVKSLSFVTNFRTTHSHMIYFLPLGGLLIVALYHTFSKNDRGTNLVISTIQAKAEIPFRMAPLISISTVITHAFGGSAGREGAALQLGGSIGNGLARVLKLDENDTRVLVMCGMSAAFSASRWLP